MNLSQLECPLELNYAEALSSFLEDEVVSVSWYEKEPERWAFQMIIDPRLEFSLRDKMKIFFKEKCLPLPEITINPLPQEDWVAAVYRDFPPLTIGRFYVYGSHIQQTSQTNLLSLRIDAATAFGSGQHESTKGCLKALSLLSEQKSFDSPLDMGCGSGILALAMARLWNIPVLACDNDSEAIRVTRENARINFLENLIAAQVSEGFSGLPLRHSTSCDGVIAMTSATVIGSEATQAKLEATPRREQSRFYEAFDIITANILAGPLCQMAGNATQALMPGGYIILSGLLNRQAADVIDAYRSVGTKLVNQLLIGDWSTLIMRKTSYG